MAHGDVARTHPGMAGAVAMTDAEVDAISRRNTCIAVACMLAALPVTLPCAVVGFAVFRWCFGWWPGQRPWSGRRYDVSRAKGVP